MIAAHSILSTCDPDNRIKVFLLQLVLQPQRSLKAFRKAIGIG